MTRDIQDAIEINKDSNLRFYEFESEIEINGLEIQIFLKGKIDEEISRISFAVFILELIEEINFNRIVLNIIDIDITSESFLELLIEIAIALLSDNIDYNIIMKSSMSSKLIIGRFKEMICEEKMGNDNKVKISFNKEKLIRFSKNNLCEKEEIIKLWESENLYATMNNEIPNKEYKYHRRII